MLQLDRYTYAFASLLSFPPLQFPSTVVLGGGELIQFFLCEIQVTLIIHDRRKRYLQYVNDFLFRCLQPLLVLKVVSQWILANDGDWQDLRMYLRHLLNLRQRTREMGYYGYGYHMIVSFHASLSSKENCCQSSMLPKDPIRQRS